MKLSECTIGKIVKTREEIYSSTSLASGHVEKEIEFISGLTKNATGEVIPIVSFAFGEDRPFHHAGLEEYKD